MKTTKENAQALIEAIFDIKEDTIENIVNYKNMFDTEDKTILMIGEPCDNYDTELIIDSIYCTDIEEFCFICKKVCG